MPPPPRALGIALIAVGWSSVLPLASLFAAALVTDRATQDFLGKGFLYGSMVWAAAYLGIAIVAIASRAYLWLRG